MKKYKVTASYITYCTAEVEAENSDQAYEIARDMDGGDFTQSKDNYDWHISDIQEVAP
jgi:uncharacterized membrane protein YkoI